jgi:putative ABC transport system permease protein
MTRLFVVAALRNLLRHKLQTLINIFSLAIGLTVFGFAFLYVKQELSYDHGWPNSERVHRLTIETRGVPGRADAIGTSVPAAEWARIRDYFGADIEAAARRTNTIALYGPQGGDQQQQNVALHVVDPQFFEVFQVETIEGDLSRTLSGPGFIAVDEAMAERLGLKGRTGERIVITSYYDRTVKVDYELAAIYRVPQPSSISGGIITLMHEYSLPMFAQPGQQRQYIPWEGTLPIWAKLRSGLETAAFNAQQEAFVQQLTTYDAALGAEGKTSDHVFYRWQPLTEMHFKPLEFEIRSGLSGDYGRVATFAAVGLLVLLVGCSNSISLSLAAAIERRREIGVRKAAGALPGDILRQQLGESVLLALCALVPAIAAVEILSPAFQTMLSFRAPVAAGLLEYALLTLIACVVGLTCGAYPALVLSSTRPQAVLRAGTQQSVKAGMSLRSALVALQFCFASMLLIGTAALYLQLAVASAQPLGFNADNVVLTMENEGVNADVMRNEFEKIPGVTSVVFGVNPPNADMSAGMNTTVFVRNTSDTVEVRPEQMTTTYGFLEMMGMRLLAGRDYDARFDQYNQEAETFADGRSRDDGAPMLVNAIATRALGFASPEEAIGQVVLRRFLSEGKVTHVPQRIVGVVEDNQYPSLRRRPGPQIYYLLQGGTRPGNLMVKYEDAVEGTIRDRLQEVSQRLNNVPLDGMIFTEEYMAAAFRQERNESKLLLICGGLALVLASFGLYGLAAFAIVRQVKEVGVRKVMGASVATILALYLWRFSRPIVFANVLAWPVAIYFVLQWIERFPYQMERAWLAPLCVGTMGAVLLIAMLTVSVITTRAATTNPVRSLRYE